MRLAGRRFESTATGKAAEAATKAQQGLSRVSGAAAGAAKGLGNALSKAGGRTGRLFAMIEREYCSICAFGGFCLGSPPWAQFPHPNDAVC